MCFLSCATATQIYTLSLHDALPICVGETTLYRWLQLPGFRAAYRQARRELVDGAIGRIQAGTGVAVEALLDRKSTRLNSSHTVISYAVFCSQKKCAGESTAYDFGAQ